LKSGSLIGFKPAGDDPAYLANRLGVHKNVLAGDFKKWDSDVRSDLMWSLFEGVVIPWFKKFVENFDYEYETVLYVLFSDLINSIHVCKNVVYALNRGMPSGHPLTSILNTLYNMYMMYICYMKLVPITFQFNEAFERNFVGFFYGDDHIISVSDAILPYFNYDTLSQLLMGVFEHKYTSCFKEELKVGKLCDALSDVTILKRKLQRVEGRWRATLDENTIREEPMFHSKTVPHDKALRENIDSAMREYFFFGRARYDLEKEKFLDKLLSHRLQHICDVLTNYDLMGRRLESDEPSIYI